MIVLVSVLVVVLVILVLILVLVILVSVLVVVLILIVHFFPPKAWLKYYLSTLLRSILLCKIRFGIIRKNFLNQIILSKPVFPAPVVRPQNQLHKLLVILCTD